MTILFTPFALFLPGYFFLKSIWGDQEKLTFWEGIILSIGLSFLLGYPLGILNNLIEYLGGGNPIQIHIDTLYPLYLLLCATLYFFSRKKKPFHEAHKMPNKKWFFIVLFLFILALVLRLYGNAFQNINGDEQELSFYAYHLIDGMFVGRHALFISASTHSPLGFYISYIVYHLITPFQYFNIPEYLVRSPMIIFGLLELGLLLLYSARLKLSKPATVLGLFLIVINTYSIFGSRLMIPQDGSVFSFFLLLFVYFYLRFLDQKTKPTRLDIFLLGVLGAATVLVKLSAILLIPPVVFFWFSKKKGSLSLLKTSLIACLFFSPVLIFNTVAYKLTGFTDVPFAKILNLLGIPATSIMSNSGLYGTSAPPFLTTLTGFLEMLMDQWSFFLSINLFISLVVVLILQKKFRQERTMVLFFGALFFTTVLFFTFNGYRAYYADFLTIPLVLLSLLCFDRLIVNKKPIIKTFFITWTLLYSISSFTYTLNTHSFGTTLSPTTIQGEFGRSGLYSFDDFSQHISLASWSFLHDAGFSSLKEFLRDNQQRLVIEDTFLAKYKHHFRWYLGIHRDVLAYYLKENYHDDHPFTVVSTFDYSEDAIGIFSYSPETLLPDDTVIKNHNEEPTMIIRVLKKK